MKKTLALVLAFALVFSTITVAFAEDAAIGADATVCKDLGMLVGDGKGVTADYLKTTPTKIQAAVMVLRLKGLEADAKAFTGTENFADADKAAWAKPIMAYLKAHPELGWVGDGKSFDPNGAVTTQMYYKVMLETLGYKQNTATVVGDFTWEKAVEFAATKGLTTTATSFTVNDLATATVQTLKANVKDTTKTLVSTLVEAGKLTKEAVEKAGLPTVPAVTAKLDAVKSVANDKVEVTFDAAVDKATAENVAAYKVVLTGSTTALEVKSATQDSDTMVVLTTATQTTGVSYTLTVGEVSKNFTGLAKETGAPEIDTVKTIDTNTVEIVFKKAMDKASAEDVANYTLNNSATVKKAEIWVDQDETRKTVKLTTEGIASGKIYKIKVANVKSSDGVAIKTVEKSFAGAADTKAPTINGNIVVKNNQRILINFTDDHGVDKATAENAENWSIVSGSETLKINKITAQDNDLDDYAYLEAVEIDTDSMTSGKTYTVTINNLADGSVSKNVVSKALTKTFIGMSVDKTTPRVGAITVLGDNRIEIEYTESSRLAPETMTDIANYTFDKDITVKSAEIIRASKPDTTLGKTVVLTTSAMEENKSYKLTIANIADEFGNVMASTTRTVVGKTEDVNPPAVEKTNWVSLTKVEVWFKERVDLDSAQDPANYSFNNSLGNTLKAELSASSGYYKVTLTTPKQIENKAYTITINGVKDRVGNAAANVKAYFTSATDGLDITRPTISAISVLSSTELRVTFDEAVAVAAGGSTITLSSGGVLTSVGQLLDDGTTVVYRAAANNIIGSNSTEYTINSITNVSDKHNNKYVVDSSDLPKFYGMSTANEKATISGWEQVDVKTFRIIFSKPVELSDGTTGSTSAATITSTGTNATAFSVYVDYNDDDTNEAESTVTLIAANKLAVDANYTFNFGGTLTTGETLRDYTQVAVGNENATATSIVLRAAIEDKDGPVIDYVEPIDATTLKIVYNEDLSAAGSYKVYDGDTVKATGTASFPYASGENNAVKFVISGSLTANTAYSLKPVVGARDVAGNTAEVKDISVNFVQSSLQVYDYVKGMKVTDSDTVIFQTTKAVGVLNTDLSNLDYVRMYEQVSNADNGANLVSSTAYVVDASKDVTVNTKVALKADKTYKVYINYNDAADTTLTYTFSGVAEDGGISVVETQDANGVVNPFPTNAGQVTFSGWDVKSYVVEVVYYSEASATSYLVVPTDMDGNDADGTEEVSDYAYVINAATANNGPATFTLTSGVISGTSSATTNNLLDKFKGADGNVGGGDDAVIGSGMTYTIRVYRLETPFTDAEVGADLTDSDYDTKVIDLNPIYSQDFTRP